MGALLNPEGCSPGESDFQRERLLSWLLLPEEAAL